MSTLDDLLNLLSKSKKYDITELKSFVSHIIEPKEPNLKKCCWCYKTNRISKISEHLIKIEKKNVCLHRLMASIVFDNIDHSIYMKNLCKNKYCINPYHYSIKKYICKQKITKCMKYRSLAISFD